MLFIWIATSAGSARAAAELPSPRRTIAVLEYRAGPKGLPGIGERVARLLSAATSFNVLGPQDARRLRPRTDGDVARCSGQAACIGGIGEQLGAGEVVLIGISQL